MILRRKEFRKCRLCLSLEAKKTCTRFWLALCNPLYSLREKSLCSDYPCLINSSVVYHSADQRYLCTPEMAGLFRMPMNVNTKGFPSIPLYHLHVAGCQIRRLSKKELFTTDENIIELHFTFTSFPE